MQTITDGTAKFIVRDKRIQAMIDLFYPVGSVYITADPEIEEADLPFMQYGTWEELPSGVCLQTVIDGKQVGAEVDAGLPNITGNTGMFALSNWSIWPKDAFYWKEPGGTSVGTTNGSTNSGGVAMDASKSNSIYGNSDTVQPPAIMVRAWKRTA